MQIADGHATSPINNDETSLWSYSRNAQESSGEREIDSTTDEEAKNKKLHFRQRCKTLPAPPEREGPKC